MILVSILKEFSKALKLIHIGALKPDFTIEMKPALIKLVTHRQENCASFRARFYINVLTSNIRAI